MGAREEVDPGHLAHVVIDDEQRYPIAGASDFAQRGQPGGGRRLADDAEVFAESPAEIVPERAGDPGVVIEHEQDWLCHLLPPRMQP